MRSRPASALVLLLALLVEGCGEQDARPREPQDGGTDVAVTVRPHRGAEPRVRGVECRPHARRAVCLRLDETTVEDFSPVPPDAACTAIYGGPATASVRGRLHGRRLEARFSLHNGCEIARWERFAWLLGDPPSTRRPPP